MSVNDIKEKIRILEDEIKQLELELDDDMVHPVEKDEIKSTFGNLDDLILDILNEEHEEDHFQIINNKRIKISKELKHFKEAQISKIRLENIFRFNGISMFPVNSSDDSRYLGVRFDLFNDYLKKYSKSEYIILKLIDANTMKGSSTQFKKWIVFQTTIPKYVPITNLSLQYLNDEIMSDDTSEIPLFHKINKFSIKIYEDLIKIEYRRSLLLEIKHRFKLDVKSISYDIAVTKIKLLTSPPVTISYHDDQFIVNINSDTAPISISNKGALIKLLDGILQQKQT